MNVSDCVRHRLLHFWEDVVSDTVTNALDQFIQAQDTPDTELSFYRDYPQDYDMQDIVDRALWKATAKPNLTYSSGCIEGITALNSLVAAITFKDIESRLDNVCKMVKEGGHFLFLFFEGSGQETVDIPKITTQTRAYLKQNQTELRFDATEYLRCDGLSVGNFVAIVAKKVKMAIPPSVIAPPLPSTPRACPGWVSSLFSAVVGKKSASNENWIPSFKWTVYNPAWDFTKQAERLLPKYGAVEVLDAGCGAGPDTAAIIQAFAKCTITGVDSDKNAEPYVKGRLRPDDQLSRFTFDCADLTAYQFQPNRYDLIVCRDVLGFIQKDSVDAIMPRMLSSLKPHGLIVLTFFAEGNGMPGTLSTYSLERVKFLFKNLVVLECKELDMIETRKNSPERQHTISILAQKPH